MLVLVASLYSASLAGLRRQLGVVGGDVAVQVDVASFYRGLLEFGQWPRCEYWKSTITIPRYLMAEPEEKLALSRDLSTARLACAATYTLNGNAERGVYTLLKGMRYEQVALMTVEQRARIDKRICDQYQTSAGYGIVEAYLGATTGRVYGVIEREYSEVQRLIAVVTELCRD